MQWETQNPDDLWIDFTMVTLHERAVHSVDDIMREFSKNPEKHQNSKFQYSEKKFIARLYPSKYSKLKSDDFNFNSPRSYPDSIRYLFNINTPFVVIIPETKNRIDEKSAHVMISSIIQAAQSSYFLYPIFINIPLKEFYEYIGICISDKSVTHYYSKTNWNYSEVSDYQSSLNFFKTKIKNMHSILFSSRRFLEINNNYFGRDAIYTHSCFYSLVNTDPITKIRILFQWNRSSPDTTGPVLSNASYLKLSVIYQTNSSPQTSLHTFLNKRISLDGKDDFKIWKGERLNSRIYAFMNNIFHNPKVTTTTFSKPINKSCSNFFKSAPENSLLEQIAVEIAEMKTLANFSMLWCEFLKNIRSCADQSIPIPGIDDSIDYKYCLIYQNLQIINSYIINGNKKFCMAENIFEQYVDLYKKARKENVLRMIILAFKNQNQNPEFNDFQKVLSLSEKDDFDEKEILKAWNETSQENFEFDAKESIEFALDYLEGLKPSEVHLQIILILFDIAIRDLSKRAPIEVPFASTPYENLIKLLNKNKNASSLPEFKLICSAIEETTLKCEIVNSALSKIPSAKFVNQLFEKGYSSMDNAEEIQAVTSLIEVMNLENLLKHTAVNEFIFTGKAKIENNDADQYLFVSKQRQEENDKYIVALAYQELL